MVGVIETGEGNGDERRGGNRRGWWAESWGSNERYGGDVEGDFYRFSYPQLITARPLNLVAS